MEEGGTRIDGPQKKERKLRTLYKAYYPIGRYRQTLCVKKRSGERIRQYCVDATLQELEKYINFKCIKDLLQRPIKTMSISRNNLRLNRKTTIKKLQNTNGNKITVRILQATN